MENIKVHLEDVEAAPVHRLAKEYHVSTEQILYTALNRLMSDKDKEALKTEIYHTKDWRKDNLPLWADACHEVHAYEGM